MFALKLKATIDVTRKLVIDLPPDTPIGDVELTILSSAHNDIVSEVDLSERGQMYARLEAAGVLTHHPVPPGIVPLTPEERLQLGTLAKGARPSLDLIDEDRSER
jgi:hypothetical protein